MFPRLSTCDEGERGQQVDFTDLSDLASFATLYDQAPATARRKVPLRLRHSPGGRYKGTGVWETWAKVLGVPTVHLYGWALLHLFGSASPSVQAFLDTDAQEVFGSRENAGKADGGATVGIHVRGGDLHLDPRTRADIASKKAGLWLLQDSRQPASVTKAIAWVDTLVARGVVVKTVLVATDIDYVNHTMLLRSFPGKPYRFKMLKRLLLPLGVEAAQYANRMYSTEIEELTEPRQPTWQPSMAAPRRPERHNQPEPRAMSARQDVVRRRGNGVEVVQRHNRTEFILNILSDMHLLSECDMLLGSPGNWMSIILTMHRAKHPTAAANHTCLMNGNDGIDCFGSGEFEYMAVGFSAVSPRDAMMVPCEDDILL